MKFFGIHVTVLLWSGALVANPTGPVITEGGAQITGIGTNDVVVNSTADRTVISWDQFSIGNSERVTFDRSGSSATYYILNHVPNGLSSTISGTLRTFTDKGNIYLVNPAGIVVDSNGIIMTGGFVGSALALFGNFNPLNTMEFTSNTKTTFTNNGTITVTSGDLILMGYRVVNNGTVTGCNTVALGAGIDLLLKPGDSERVFIQTSAPLDAGTGILAGGTISGQAIVLKADNNPYTLAINLTGKINVTACNGLDGTVKVIANQGTLNCLGAVQISGTIQRSVSTGTGPTVTVLGKTIALTSTGSINVTGSTGGGAITIGTSSGACPTTSVYIASGSQITSNATSSGSGGTINLSATESVLFLGNISAQGTGGTANGGNAGMTSLAYLGMDGIVNLASTGATRGTLTLTNSDINVGGAANYGSNFAPPNYTIVAVTSVATKDKVEATLDKSNVSVVAHSDIDVVNTITWSSGAKLSLSADDAINVQKLVTMTGSVASATPVLALQADMINIGLVGGTSSVPTGFLLTTGSITASATDSIYLYGGNADSSFARLSTSSGNQVITFANNFDLLAGSANAAHAQLEGTSVTIDALSSGGVGNMAITAEDCSMAFIDAQTVLMGTKVHLNNVGVTAGCCSNANGAYIGSFTTGSGITMNLNGDLTLRGGISGTNNRASILSSGGTSKAIVITANNIRLNGGSGGTSNQARIASLGSLGSVNITAAADLILSGGSGIFSSAHVTGVTTALTIGRDLLITGGSGNSSSAYIEGTSGITAGITRYIHATGGSAPFAYAEIKTTNGDLTINSLNNGSSYRFEAGKSGSANALARLYIANNGNISVTAGSDIIYLGGGLGDTPAYAFVGGVGDITHRAGRDIFMTTGTQTTSDVYLLTTKGKITAIAGRDLALKGDCVIPNIAYITSNGSGSSTIVAAGRDITQLQKTLISSSGSLALTASRNHVNIGCLVIGAAEPFKFPWYNYIFLYELFYRLRFFNIYDWYSFHHATFWDSTDYTDP